MKTEARTVCNVFMEATPHHIQCTGHSSGGEAEPVGGVYSEMDCKKLAIDHGGWPGQSEVEGGTSGWAVHSSTSLGKPQVFSEGLSTHHLG